MKTNLAVSLILSSTQSILLNKEENPLNHSTMTPWEWKIFTDKERFAMYTTSKNIVEESNKRIVEYEKQEAKDNEQIKA